MGALVGVRTPGHPDRDQVRSVSFFPLTGAVGSRPGVGGLLVDVTDREQAIMEATAGRQRLALLDRAAARIGTTLDVDVTARELVDAAVPDFSDASVVEVVEWMDEPEVFDPELPLVTRRIAAGTILPPPATELVSGLENVTYPPGSAIHRMLLTGRPVSVLVNDEFMTRTVIHQARAQLLRDSGLACILIAPLIARGTVQGITMFGRSAARPAFTEEDLSLAGELASRAALCLDNARLYSRVQDIALTLQRALLPSALATSPYVEVAHRYLPGSHITEVGGDWYDVINLPGDRVALVVGDVMGHGVPAAAAMGRLRITAKALARHNQEPDDLLTELDACAQEAGIELATCLYILYDPTTGRARIASAGHPPPLVRHPDGTVETISDVLGVPLGVGGQPFRTIEITLPEDAILALYTDGLIEARGQDIEEGLEAVRAELRRAPGQLEETSGPHAVESAARPAGRRHGARPRPRPPGSTGPISQGPLREGRGRRRHRQRLLHRDGNYIPPISSYFVDYSVRIHLCRSALAGRTHLSGRRRYRETHGTRTQHDGQLADRSVRRRRGCRARVGWPLRHRAGGRRRHRRGHKGARGRHRRNEPGGGPAGPGPKARAGLRGAGRAEDR